MARTPIWGGKLRANGLPPSGLAGSRCLTVGVRTGKMTRARDEAHSSSGPGHRPLKAEITGSNPVCATGQGR